MTQATLIQREGALGLRRPGACIETEMWFTIQTKIGENCKASGVLPNMHAHNFASAAAAAAAAAAPAAAKATHGKGALHVQRSAGSA
jgi:hypothetical protein